MEGMQSQFSPMQFLGRPLQVFALSAFCCFVPDCELLADAPAVYARQRVQHRGEYLGYAAGAIYGHQPGGFYGGFFVPPVVTGSWYARPYPYHMDFHQVRSRVPMPVPDCPCDEPAIAN